MSITDYAQYLVLIVLVFRLAFLHSRVLQLENEVRRFMDDHDTPTRYIDRRWRKE